MATSTAEQATAAAERYRAALRAFARGSGPAAPSDAQLAALYRLNAVYYLDAYLPAGLHGDAIGEAAAALDAASPRTTEPRASQHGSDRRREPAVRRLLVTLNCRGAGTADIIAAQHALEIAPELDEAGAAAVLNSMLRRLASAPTDRHARAALARARRDGLAEWAGVNARPPREGETAGWAVCVAKRPEAALQRTLASRLQFSALLDALTLAAAQRSAAGAGHHPLVAAHAVRRLSELGGKPALGPWLSVAMGLGAAPTRDGVDETAEASELALAAVRSGDVGLVQLAEAALMEREALSSELRDAPLTALSGALTQNANIAQ